MPEENLNVSSKYMLKEKKKKKLSLVQQRKHGTGACSDSVLREVNPLVIKKAHSFERKKYMFTHVVEGAYPTNYFGGWSTPPLPPPPP